MTDTNTAGHVLIPDDVLDNLVAVAKRVYNGGYVKNTMTWDERTKLRGDAYRALKALGLEK